MSFLLDTNVLSEPMKERPNAGVVAWLSQANEDRVFVSVVTITELRYGVERLPIGKRRELLDGWLRKDLILRFEGRILPVDLRIADACGGLMARSESMGRPIEARDAFIAATAEVHGLILVTRNTSDFKPSLKAIISPWT
jgi:predicted nucleic acid-binding protein